jgi:PTH1 family peptidyl-tRNA hydrolase
MNASGEAVSALCQKNGIDPAELCVVLDEIELPLGTLRMRRKGSAGGHNGLASVIAQLGRSDFPRLRVGVRGARYRKGARDLADYVLEPFGRDEASEVEDALARAVEALRIWVAEGVDSAMRFANAKTSSPGPASDPD